VSDEEVFEERGVEVVCANDGSESVGGGLVLGDVAV
jgi:hypothetical protein